MSKLMITLFSIIIIPLYGYGEAKKAKKDPNPKSVHIVWLENPPFAGEKLPNKGIYPDIVATVLRDAGYKVRVSILPWQRAVDGVKNLDFDINVGVWEHPMFESDFDYLRNISIDPLTFVVLKKNNFKTPTLEAGGIPKLVEISGETHSAVI